MGSLAAEALEQVARHSSELDFPDEWYRLDTERYHSPEFAQAEWNAVWSREWQFACRSDEVGAPGDWVEYGVGNQSFIVVRGESGEVRAFRNVCRHRGNRLCSGRGRARQFICPFHLWKYNLDGSLHKVLDRETFVSFKDEDYGLISIPAAEWGGFVFINLDRSAAPFADFIAPIAPYLDAYQIADMIPVGLNITMKTACNWKVGIDAFSESYHTAGIHPQNLPMVNDYDQRYVFFEKHAMFMVPFVEPAPRLGKADPARTVKAMGVLAKVFGGQNAANPADALVAPHRTEDGRIDLPEGVDMRILAREAARAAGVGSGLLTDSQLTDNFNFLIFPNLSLNLRPGEMTAFRFRPDPSGDPQRCIWDAASYKVVTDAAERARLREPHRDVGPDDDIGLVLNQDRQQFPRQQLGLVTQELDHLMLSRQEAALVHFHRVLDACIAAGGSA